MRINGTVIKIPHIALLISIVFALSGTIYNYGALGATIKTGLAGHEKRIIKLECKQEQIWEMVRTQHVYDSLSAIAKGDSMFMKAVNIVENGNDTIDTDTLP